MYLGASPTAAIVTVLIAIIACTWAVRMILGSQSSTWEADYVQIDPADDVAHASPPQPINTQSPRHPASERLHGSPETHARLAA
jgi:hypothetical protein